MDMMRREMKDWRVGRHTCLDMRMYGMIPHCSTVLFHDD